jgi:PAS domain S-box-containing protein
LKSILAKFIREPIPLPAKLLARFAESATCAPYLVSCFERPAILYLSPRFEDITGYSCQQFQNEGLKFLFSVIHPADVPSVSDRIARAHYELATHDSPPKEPLELEYRIRRADGTVVWIRELKQIVSFRDRRKDHILGCFLDITAEREGQAATVNALLKKEKDIHGLLEVAVDYQSSRNSTCKAIQISKREKEVLKLVAAGSSSKQIAAELSISENTVETHRRRLLAKFKVNNSTALIQEAHRAGQLPPHGFP